LADNTNWNGWVTPDLARNPGLATDTYNSKLPNAVGTVLSHTAKGVSTLDAINDHSEGNGTQTFWSRLGTDTINTLGWLGKPLKEVQRDYKFVHSVYVDHGFLPGFAASLGILGAGVAGTVVAGPLGGVLAADAAGAATRKALGNIFKDSYAKSEDENYKVSPGRDFSNVLSTASSAVGADAMAKTFRDTSKGFGKVVSGGGDIAFDITMDPLSVAGRFSQLMKTGKLVNLSKAGEIQIKYPILDSIPGVKNFVISRTGAPLTSEQMDLVRSNAGKFFGVGAQYNRALDDLAKSTAGEIVQKYPQLGTVAAGRIGALKTADEVHNFLKTSLYFGEMQGTLAGQAMMPARTILRSKLGDSKVVDYLRNDGSLPGKIYKTFSGYMPYSVDAETQKLSLTKFRWNSNDAATTVYRIARIGMGDRAAKEWAGQYAQAVVTGDLALARSVKNNALTETFKALGLPDDNKFVTHIWNETQKLEQPLVGTQVYGVDYAGRILGEYETLSGATKTAGLVKHQAQEMFNIPDFREIRKAMRQAGQYNKFVGKLDDFTSSAITGYTNNVFKPLALATAGFGLRVAAAEMIPTFARYGVMNTVKSKIIANAAKTKFNLIKGEDEDIASATLVGLGAGEGIANDVLSKGFPAFKKAKELKLKFAEKLTSEEQIDLATRLVMANNGHILSEAVQTGHGYDANTSFFNNQAAHYYFQLQKNSPLFRDQPEWTTYSSSDMHYAPRLTTNLNKASKEVSNSNIAGDILRYQKNYAKAFKREGELVPVSPKLTTSEFYDTPEFIDMRKALVESEYKRMMASIEGKYKPYDAERKVLTRWRDGDIHQFAEDRVDSTLGMLVGKDGTFHEKWADNVAKGLDTDLNSIAELSRKNPQSLPVSVSGPMLQPYVPSKNPITYIVNLGFKKVIDPIVNGLAREPLYVLHVGDAYKRLETQIAKGWISEDQALRIAQTQASYGMLPQIHNTALRSQFAQLANNFLPFYFAQEQALKRAFNTLKDTSIASPIFSRGMRFYQLAEHAMSDPTFMTTDENGNKFVNIPLVGEFGSATQNALSAFGVPIVSGLPISVKGSTVSLKSVLPELQTPGVSPMMAVSGNLLADFFPSLKGVVQGTVGDISFQRGVLDSLVPATWAKTALSALTPIDLQNQMNSALASALASAYYNGQVPDATSSDYDRQAFVDRIKNNARSILLIKTFLNLTSPLAPQVKQEDPGLREEFWKLVKANNNNFADALQQFLGDHGTRAVSYTVGKTESAIRGLRLPYIQETVDYIRANKNQFDPRSGVSTGAFFLVPQDNSKNESDRAVYGELMNMHLRSQRTPQELLKQFYVSQGYAQMAPEITKHVAALQQAQNIPALAQLEQDRWSAVMTKMKNLYPLWYSDYTNPDRRIEAQTAVNQLNKIFTSPNPPQHEQAKLVKELLDKYNQYVSQKSQFNMMNIRGVASQMNKQNWEDYLMTRAEQDPRLNSVIYSVFLKLG
jgi:hypothetical protein